MKTFIFALYLITGVAMGQTRLPDFYYDYASGTLAAPTYVVGGVDTKAGYEANLARFNISVQGDGRYVHRYLALTSEETAGYAYGNISIGYQEGDGGITMDYVRQIGHGRGVNIARKTAVSGHPEQWAVWAHQYALGPGTKAAFWIHGENNAVVPNIMVVGDIEVQNGVIQWNVKEGTSGLLFRIFKDGKITAELTAEGVLRVKAIEIIP
jgi:hypothetical protein